MAGTITTGWLIVILFGGLVVFFFGLGKLTQGTGADLVGFDPIGRDEERRAHDAEDLRQMLALENERRRRRGLSELSEEDVYRGALTRDDEA